MLCLRAVPVCAFPLPGRWGWHLHGMVLFWAQQSSRPAWCSGGWRPWLTMAGRPHSLNTVGGDLGPRAQGGLTGPEDKLVSTAGIPAHLPPSPGGSPAPSLLLSTQRSLLFPVTSPGDPEGWSSVSPLELSPLPSTGSGSELETDRDL